MKNLFFYFLICLSVNFFACQPTTDPPNCDNTTNTCNISLDFTTTGTFYYCDQGIYMNAQPPFATSTNYTTTRSSTDAITSTDVNAYLCEINVKNDEPSQTYCLNPGVGKYFWLTPGYTQNVTAFSHYDTDITVDYYEPEDEWCNKGRPYFSGATGLPAGTGSAVIPMFTQANYTP